MEKKVADEYPIEAHAALDLCFASYQEVGLIAKCVAKATALDFGGSWSLVWGPVLHEGNLVYIAAYSPKGAAAPSAYAIAVRGTTLKEWTWESDVHQLMEDVGVTKLKSIPWKTNSEAKIAKGTANGVRSIWALKDQKSQKTLESYLSETIGAIQKSSTPPKLLVTGHSLGGCLTLPLALWVHERVLPDLPIIQPITFAALTAGNKTFVGRCAKAFPHALGYGNELDVFAHCWHDTQTILTIYGKTCPTPEEVKIPLIWLEIKLPLKGILYAQQTTGYKLLSGNPHGNLKWGDEMMSQHHLSNYFGLLGFLVPDCQ